MDATRRTRVSPEADSEKVATPLAHRASVPPPEASAYGVMPNAGHRWPGLAFPTSREVLFHFQKKA
jgi:hypothetical protein